MWLVLHVGRGELPSSRGSGGGLAMLLRFCYSGAAELGEGGISCPAPLLLLASSRTAWGGG